MSESEIFGDEVAVADVDLSFLEYERSKLFNYSFGNTDEYKFIEFTASLNFDRTDRKYEKTPFVPVDDNELKNRINLILNIQSEGLARRVKHTNCKTLVIGLSGGLDSTLALLVACRAMDKLSSIPLLRR